MELSPSVSPYSGRTLRFWTTTFSLSRTARWAKSVSPVAALGYMGSKPEQENFVVTADGGRLYRSGDLGYRLPDGNLAFLHRKDKQVMIMGKRVECDEVENLLCTCSEVETAVVSANNDTQGLSYLTAYIVPRRNFSLAELKRKLSKYLTAFMIPEYFVLMPAIPLNTNGKPDRKSLPIIIKESRLYA